MGRADRYALTGPDGELVESPERETRGEFNGVSTTLAPRTPALAETLSPESLEELIQEAQIKGEGLLGEFLVRRGGINSPAGITEVAFVAALSVARGDLTTGRSSEIRKGMELAHATMVASSMGGNTVNYITQLQVLAGQAGEAK